MRVLDQPLAFVDIETSGSHYKNGRVIEIGIVRLERGQIATYQALIDPGHPLPEFITNLTGIRDADLASKPSFRDVACDITEFIDGAVFVAHNARFDYSFLSHEFKRIGVDFKPKMLCTVRLSRLLYPGSRGHSLDRLIQRFNFSSSGRHRALADAQVLLDFLERAIDDFGRAFVDEAANKLIQQPALPIGLSSQLIDSLPRSCGVYVFEDGDGQPLYIGKSVDIRSRALAHFSSDTAVVKELRLAQTVRHISYFETAGELSALLLENAMIKRLQPLHNRLQRRNDSLVSVTGNVDQNGYLQLKSARIREAAIPTTNSLLAVFRSEKTAKQALANLAKKHHLCGRLLGIEKTSPACFGYQLRRCRGACIQRERPEVYNLRLQTAFAGQGIDDWPYLSPIVITETNHNGISEAIVVDRWCPIKRLKQDADGLTTELPESPSFDLDTYRLIKRFISDPKNQFKIKPLARGQLTASPTAI